MKRIAALTLFALLAAPVSARADVSSKMKSLTSWFTHWKQALERSAVESRYRRNSRMTAVAAVRGAGQAGEDPRRPYWKGTWSKKKAEERLAERQELAAAVGLILEGKTEEGSRALAAFEQAHPKSSLLADVAEAKGKLAEMAPEPAAAEKPAGEAMPAADAPAPAEKPAAEAAKPAAQ